LPRKGVLLLKFEEWAVKGHLLHIPQRTFRGQELAVKDGEDGVLADPALKGDDQGRRIDKFASGDIDQNGTGCLYFLMPSLVFRVASRSRAYGSGPFAGVSTTP